MTAGRQYDFTHWTSARTHRPSSRSSPRSLMTTLPGVRTRRHRLLVGGEWSDATDGDTATLTSPATGEPVVEVAAAGPGDVDRAVRLADEAFERNRWRTPFERAAELERIADVIDARRETMAADLVLEHGKPLAEAL